MFNIGSLGCEQHVELRLGGRSSGLSQDRVRVGVSARNMIRVAGIRNV